MKQVISGTGELLDLKQWQQFKGILRGDKLSENFTWQEFECEGEFLISEVLIDFLQVIRRRWGKPMKVNSGYRTKAKQEQLKAQGYKAATFSPHTKGMAADIDTTSKQETNDLAQLMVNTAKQLKLPIRVGYLDYLKVGQTFVHIDVCPHYYGKGRPYYEQNHPPAWEKAYLTW